MFSLLTTFKLYSTWDHTINIIIKCFYSTLLTFFFKFQSKRFYSGKYNDGAK